MSEPKRIPTRQGDLDSAQAEIERLVANPPPPRLKRAEKHETFGALEIFSNIDGFRRKLAADRGLTLEQWLELESKVSHPREFVPVIPSEAAIARRRMLGARVPEKFIRAVGDAKPLDCKPMRDVSAFLDSRDGFLLLSGGKGTRKTGSASWALGQLDGGVFVHAQDLVETSVAPEHRERWDYIVNRAPLVVFDDLGTEKRTGDLPVSFGTAFSRLVDKVYSGCRRMIITHNITKATMKGVYGEREFDRMREVGKWSDIAGESVRTYQERIPGSDDE